MKQEQAQQQSLSHYLKMEVLQVGIQDQALHASQFRSFYRNIPFKRAILKLMILSYTTELPPTCSNLNHYTPFQS